jgi:signal transduction histidine kinase
VRFRLVERANPAILAACVLVCVQALLSFLVRHSFGLTVFGDLTQCILLLSGLICFLVNLAATRGRTKLFWALMAVGFGFWLSAQALWTYFEVFLHKDVPNPFVGDVILFLHIVPMMGALALQPHSHKGKHHLYSGSLDFVLLLMWWLYLYLFLVIPWQYVSFNETRYGHSFNVVYVTEHIVFLVGAGLLWLRSAGSWRVIYAHWFGAGLLYAISSYCASVAIDLHLYYTGSFYDVPLLASMVWFMGVAILSRKLIAESAPHQADDEQGLWPARFAMIAILSMPLLLVWAVFHSAPEPVRTFRVLLTAAAMLALGFLVFLRQHFLDQELIGLLRVSRESLKNLKRTQTQLLQSEKLASLSLLVGGAAHEINNPVMAILGFSELLVGSAPLTQQQRSLVEKIGEQAERTKTLISDLLKFARRVPTEKSSVYVNALIQTAVKVSQPILCAKRVEIKLQMESGLPPLLCDSNELLQVCLHIISNAVDALQEVGGGTLTVSSLQENDHLVLEFSDDGPGMREPERVFDPFYTTKPIGKGTGLGLSACYGIIQEHNGQISCQNRPEGGSTFRIELPVAPLFADSSETQVGVRVKTL